MKIFHKSAYLFGAGFLLCGLLLAQDRVVIRGGTLVNVRDGKLTPDATIVVEGDRIVSVSPGGASPQGATVINAAGKYIIPGLIELHSHYKDWVAELFLNYGVTTVVDLGAPHEWIQAQKEGIEKGFVPGPRLFAGAYNYDGPEDSEEEVTEWTARPYVHTVTKPEDAMAALEPFIQGPSKVDSIKVLENLSEPTLRAIVREARKGNLPVIGHFKDVRVAIAAGANGIEHLNSVAYAMLDSRLNQEARAKLRPGVAINNTAFIDVKQLPGVIQLMVKNNAYWNPTLLVGWTAANAVREKFSHEAFDLLFNNWRLRYVPLSWRLALLKEYQEVGLWHWADLTPYEKDLYEKGYQNAQLIVKTFAEAGGKLYTGTDCAGGCTPGLGTHQEMEMIADSGAGPLPALQSATINSAELMRMADRLGTIEAGKVGDVVILDANPLEDIRNTRKIFRVISRGRVLDGQYHPEFENPLPRNEWEDTGHMFPSPELRWATPAAVVEGSMGTSLTVRGTGFLPYSIIRFNGHKLKTTFLSRYELRTELPDRLLVPGTYNVDVESPDFASGTTVGPAYLYPLGIRSNISNPFLVLVKPKGGAPIHPHPREK